MAKRKKVDVVEDDLSIPAFLKVANRGKGGAVKKTVIVKETKKVDHSTLPGMAVLSMSSQQFVARQLDAQPPESVEALRTLEPVVCAYIVREISKCRFNLRWMQDPGALVPFAIKAQEAEERRLAGIERLKGMRGPKKVNPLEGLVPLRTVLEKMGDKAPTRKNAMRAIEAAKLEHTKFHFQPGAITLARVENALMSYVPPVKARGGGAGGPKPEFDSGAVIQFPGDNPKKEGSAPFERWSLLKKHHGKTVAVFLEAGGNPVTLKNALLTKHATLKGGGMKGATAVQVVKDDLHADEKPKAKAKKVKPAKKVKARKKRT